MSDERNARDAGPAAESGERATDPLVGTTLKGTYQVVRKIAEGGMGIVYEGEHVRLKRRVAIKVLLAQYARHPEVIERFRREAEIVGGLGHPHIVQVFDVDETDRKEPFLVMEYLDGETLAERLEREPRLPLATSVRIASQVASALTSTHDKGIVHRDLKPENVYLVKVTGEKEFAKVLDFGISKVRGGGPRLTAQNMVIGTPAYMAPEQARGERDVDHRVDQFALAAMTYEMLSGHSPFPGEDPVEIMTRVIAANPTPLSKLAWVPTAVESVVMRGMRKLPDERFPNVAEYSAALERAMSGAEVATTLPPDDRRTARAPIELLEAASLMPDAVPTSVARSERPTPAAPSRSPLPSRPSRSSNPPARPLIESGRTPPPTPVEHRVEHFTPASRRQSRTPVSQPSSPKPESVPSVRSSATHSEVPQSVPPYERISKSPSGPPSAAPPPSRQGSPTPEGLVGKNVQRAQQELEEARAALKLGRLDDAVRHAEQLLELAVLGKDTALYEVLRNGMPVVNHIFEARVGPLDRRLEITAVARDPEKLNLSTKAAFILSCAEGGATIQEVLDISGIPRRDVIRMLAGLMRRGALVAH